MDSRCNNRTLTALRARLLGGVSLVCLTLAAGEPAFAADVTVKTPPSFYERFQFSLEGGPIWNQGPHNLDFAGVLDALHPLKPGQNGGMVGASIGYAIDATRDWRFSWHGSSLGTNSESAIADNPFRTRESATDKLWFQTFDAEMGYRFAGMPGVRWLVGARVVNANNDVGYGYSDSSKLGNFAHNTELWGVGPRAGLEATMPIPDTQAFLTMSGSASAILSRRNHDLTFNYDLRPPAAAGSTSFDRWIAVYNLEASAMLGFHITSNATFEIGYRVQQFWNLVPQISRANDTGGFASGEGDVLVHGPVAKLTVAWP